MNILKSSMFEFQHAERRENKLNIKKGAWLSKTLRWGSFAAKIVAAGGKQRMPVRECFFGRETWGCMADPLDTILEIVRHSDDLTYSAGHMRNKALQVVIRQSQIVLTRTAHKRPRPDGLRPFYF